MVSVRRPARRKLLWILAGIVAAYAAISMVATKIVYDSIFVRYDTPAPQTPEELTSMVAQREAVQYYSGENRLCGYLYRADGAQDQHTLVILVPGLNAGADDYLWQISSLLEEGWSVFAFDATGTRASQGESAVGFSQILLDLNETVKYVEKSDCFGYNDLVLFGHSRGGYAACCALSGEYDISAVISVSGVNSPMEGIIGASAQYVGVLAYGNYGGLWLYQTMLFGADAVNTTAQEALTDSSVPVLIIHGSEDPGVPAEKYSIMSHRSEIKSDRVQYILCTDPGQNGHTSLLFDPDGTANDKLMAQIDAFLESTEK